MPHRNEKKRRQALFFTLIFAQIIKAKVPAQTITITEMPIKKYFTFHRSAYPLIRQKNKAH